MRRLRGRWHVAAIRPGGKPDGVWALPKGLIGPGEDAKATAIREVEPGKGFVELTRRYVVAGTTELRRETLFLGYRLLGREWRLVELRSAP